MEHYSPTVHDPRNASVAGSEPDDLRSVCTEIRILLDQKRFEFTNEIRRYPPPIPTCDAHFNFLLEERARISHEISCADELSGMTRSKYVSELISAFVDRCAYLDDTVKESLRRRLKTAL